MFELGAAIFQGRTDPIEFARLLKTNNITSQFDSREGAFYVLAGLYGSFDHLCPIRVADYNILSGSE